MNLSWVSSINLFAVQCWTSIKWYGTCCLAEASMQSIKTFLWGCYLATNSLCSLRCNFSSKSTNLLLSEHPSNTSRFPWVARQCQLEENMQVWGWHWECDAVCLRGLRLSFACYTCVTCTCTSLVLSYLTCVDPCMYYIWTFLLANKFVCVMNCLLFSGEGTVWNLPHADWSIIASVSVPCMYHCRIAKTN